LGHVFDRDIQAGGNVLNVSERLEGIHVGSSISGCSSLSTSHFVRTELTGRIDPDTAEILDTAEFEYTQLMEKMTPLPWEFNVPWTERDIFRTEAS
jgi:hypothetical protein